MSQLAIVNALRFNNGLSLLTLTADGLRHVLELGYCVDLVVSGLRNGVATFAEDGSEQDALAEFLAACHATPETAYNAPHTAVGLDTRIQQTLFRVPPKYC